MVAGAFAEALFRITEGVHCRQEVPHPGGEYCGRETKIRASERV